jgi:hypothetical protein
MKKVDLFQKHDKVNPKYLGVPQPMFIYHSKEEFFINEVQPIREGISKKPLPIIIKGMHDLYNCLKEIGILGKAEFINITENNVWIATGETFIPDKTTPEGYIIYKMGEDNKPIPTDNCFIQLHVVYLYNNKYLLFCSSGMFITYISYWEVTAAEKSQFLRVNDITVSKKTYDQKLTDLLRNKRINAQDLRLFNCFFNPLSKSFMNSDAAVVAVHGFTIKKADRKKLFETDKFRRLILREMTRLMPEFYEALKKNISADEAAQMTIDFVKSTVKDDKVTVKEKIESMDYLFTKRFPDEVAKFDQPLSLNPVTQTPMIGAGLTNTGKELAPAGQVLYEDGDLVKTPDPDKEPTEEEKVAEKKLREELGVVEEYTSEGDDVESMFTEETINKK